jgi:hypothetical protein
MSSNTTIGKKTTKPATMIMFIAKCRILIMLFVNAVYVQLKLALAKSISAPGAALSKLPRCQQLTPITRVSEDASEHASDLLTP